MSFLKDIIIDQLLTIVIFVVLSGMNTRTGIVKWGKSHQGQSVLLYPVRVDLP